MVTEILQYRGARLGTKLIAGGVVALASGIGAYIALDNFGTQLHLGVQDIPTKIIEAAGVGVWAGLSVSAILAEARIPVRQDLRRTGPLQSTTS